MATPDELLVLSADRLVDAKILYSHERFEGAVYLCGYAVEFALKSKICQLMKWSEYPSSELTEKQSRKYKVHDLEKLLLLSGEESRVKNVMPAEWSVLTGWDPGMRYSSMKPTDSSTDMMIKSAEKFLKGL